VSGVLCACVCCVWGVFSFVLSACGAARALYDRIVVVRAVCSVLCVLHAFRQFCVHLYVLCQFCVCGCDLCVVVKERLCVCLAV